MKLRTGQQPVGVHFGQAIEKRKDHVKGIEQVSKAVYWHRELPPRDAKPIGDHTIEATSGRVPQTLEHRDAMWDRCYRELMDRTRLRLAQEIVRLGGDYAHVLKEEIAPRHDDRTGEAWMYGRFDYELYRRPEGSPVEASLP
jgi:hypothetical protein